MKDRGLKSLQRAFSKVISDCPVYIMSSHDVIEQITPGMVEGSKWWHSTHPGSRLLVPANATDWLGRFPEAQLILLGIRVFSFLEGKNLGDGDYCHSRAGREI